MATAKKQKRTALPPSKAKTAYGLLSEVRKLILDEPKRYYQGDWIRRGPDARRAFGENVPACGTVGCVAGWVCELKQPATSYIATRFTAQTLLGIDDAQVNELFGADRVSGERQTPAYARAGAAHIRRFQREHEQQLKAKAV